MKKIDIKVICIVVVVAVLAYNILQFRSMQEDITNEFIFKLNIIQVF